MEGTGGRVEVIIITTTSTTTTTEALLEGEWTDGIHQIAMLQL